MIHIKNIQEAKNAFEYMIEYNPDKVCTQTLVNSKGDLNQIQGFFGHDINEEEFKTWRIINNK